MKGKVQKNAKGSHTLAKHNSKICVTGSGFSFCSLFSEAPSIAVSEESSDRDGVAVPIVGLVPEGPFFIVASATTASEVGATCSFARSGVCSLVSSLISFS